MSREKKIAAWDRIVTQYKQLRNRLISDIDYRYKNWIVQTKKKVFATAPSTRESYWKRMREAEDARILTSRL